MTGDVSSLGTISRAAVELAVEEVNTQGGVSGQPIQVVYEDGQCSPQPASSAAAKLINANKVNAIIGGLCSSETSAFASGAMQQKKIVISYCSSAPTLSQTGKYFFRTYPSDSYQGRFAAEYAYNKLGVKKVAIIYHISDWGTGLRDVFAARFAELGGTIVLDEGTLQEARDYRTQLTKLKNIQADYLYAPVYVEGGIALINQMNQLGIKTRILAGDTFSDPKLKKEASGKADILFTQTITPSGGEFLTKLTAKTKVDQMPLCAPQAYDAVKILTKSANEVGLDPDKLADAIRATNYIGVSGQINFDVNGDLTSAAYKVSRITDGKSVDLN
ncbi:MAG: ABC transporter substrate-binding protein [Patescibacteria group bacterium]